MPLDDYDDERDQFRPPLPRDDRLWLHPSELAAERAVEATSAVDSARSRRRNLAASGSVVLGTAAVIGLVFLASTMRESPAPTTVAARPATSPTAAQRELVRIDAGAADGTTRSATAVVIRADGYLLTTLRAVGSTAPLLAALPDGRQLVASVVGTDRVSGLAVVRVPASGLAVTATGDPTELVAGEDTTAIGATGTPMAAGKVTHVQAVDHTAPMDDNTSLFGLIVYERNPVDSTQSSADNGVLVDDDGRVTALCLWPTGAIEPVAASAADGAGPAATVESAVGYAIPIDQARSTADELIAKGQASHAWLGVRGGDVDTAAHSSSAPTQGAQLTQVQPGSPAERAGLQVGDVVVAVDRTPIATMSDLVAEIQAHRPGSTMTITVVRRGKAHTVHVVLETLPS